MKMKVKWGWSGVSAAESGLSHSSPPLSHSGMTKRNHFHSDFRISFRTRAGVRHFVFCNATMAEKNTGSLNLDGASSSPENQTGSSSGDRPECFSSTLQECLFVLTATMSIGMSSFLYGICTVITAPIGRTLNMTSAQITWINASSS